MNLPQQEQTSSAEQARWFAEEVQPHETALRGYLRNHFPSLDPDDVVQESFTHTVERSRSGKVESPRGFLFIVARNIALNLIRHRKFLSGTPVNELSSSCVLDGNENVVEAVCSRDEFNFVIEAIRSLPPRCREIVALRLIRGIDNSAIAERLGLSEQTVRVQVARGVKRCAEFLRERGIIRERNP